MRILIFFCFIGLLLLFVTEKLRLNFYSMNFRGPFNSKLYIQKNNFIDVIVICILSNGRDCICIPEDFKISNSMLDLCM